jgi:DNA-binding CsgD family transcriptional regulator
MVLKNDLTPKEKEIVTLVSKGLSNREIAQILSIEEMTVKIHINHILNKLGLRSRAQLIAHYYTYMSITNDNS